MTTERKIIAFVKKQSKGLVTLTDDDAKQIIDIAKSTEATAILFRYDMQSSVSSGKHIWQKIQEIQVSNDQIKQMLEKHKDARPVDQAYKWELRNSLGQWEGDILTLNSALF